MYKCATCGAKVTLVNGVLLRECAHHTAPVVAEMQAKVYGEGGAK